MTKKAAGTLKLPRRLGAVAEFISANAVVADIGTDHGLLPVYLALTGNARQVFASDISDGSLGAARRLAAKYRVSDKITFINAPGLDGIAQSGVDTIVIAGLGGETIVDILNKVPWKKHQNIKLILQPQSKLYILARFLYNNEYTILQTKTVLDKGRQYAILHARAYSCTAEVDQ